MGWYALHVLTGKECLVAHRLGLNDIQTLVPMEEVPERRGDRWEFIPKLMFPGYVFMNASLTPEIYHSIREMPFVIRFLGRDQGRLPEEIPQAEMEPWMILWNSGEPFGVSEGERVDGRTRIRSGPLLPLEDRIVSVDARQRRAKIELQVMGRTYRLVVGILMKSNSSQAADEQSPCGGGNDQNGLAGCQVHQNMARGEAI